MTVYGEIVSMHKEELYLSIINNLRDGVYFVDADRRIQFWNKAAEEITGYTLEEMLGKSCQDSKLNHIDEDGRPLCQLGCPVFNTLADGTHRMARIFVRHKDGYRIPLMVNIFPIHEGKAVVGAVEVFTKNSPKVYEDDLIEKLSGIAMHDALTRLPNRRYLESFLDFKLSEYSHFSRPFALLFADIDNFGKFNNEYGHDAGDAVLTNIALSLQNTMRSMDLVGRWGGEEYVGIYSIAKDSEALIIGEKFRQLVSSTEVVYGDKTLNVSISVGVTVVRPGDTVQSIVERADHLMYESKRNGKNRVTVQ